MNNELSDEFYKGFLRFEDLPDNCQNLYGASRWFKSVAPLNFADVCGLFQQLPSKFVTEELRAFAICEDARVIGLIDPADTADYFGLCGLAYRTDYKSAALFKQEARTKEAIEMMMISWSFVSTYSICPWIAQSMTPDLIEKASIANMNFMLTLPRDQISQAALNTHLGHSFSNYSYLKKAGRLRLGAEYLQQGVWPEATGPFEDNLKKPGSLEEAFSELIKPGLNDWPEVYMAYLMSHPIEDVIAAVTSPSHAKNVLEMYSEQELRPHIKNNRLLKATLLECSLGL
jgi:hypothetical protein